MAESDAPWRFAPLEYNVLAIALRAASIVSSPRRRRRRLLNLQQPRRFGQVRRCKNHSSSLVRSTMQSPAWPNRSLNRTRSGMAPGPRGRLVYHVRAAQAPCRCAPVSSDVRPRRNQIACRRQYQLDDAIPKGKPDHLLSTLAEKLSQKDSFKIASRVILWRNQTPMALRAA